MHTLGGYHHHQRIDRDNYVTGQSWWLYLSIYLVIHLFNSLLRHLASLFTGSPKPEACYGAIGARNYMRRRFSQWTLRVWLVLIEPLWPQWCICTVTVFNSLKVVNFSLTFVVHLDNIYSGSHASYTKRDDILIYDVPYSYSSVMHYAPWVCFYHLFYKFSFIHSTLFINCAALLISHLHDELIGFMTLVLSSRGWNYLGSCSCLTL